MGYFKKAVILTFIGLYMLVAAPIHARAEFVDIFDKALPVFDGLSQETFDKKARVYEDTPFADEALAYQVKLPQVWKQGKSFGYHLSKDIFVEIGRYTGPVKFNKANSYVVVQARDIGLQASAKTMAAAMFRDNGFTVQGAHEYSRNHVDTLHVEVINGESYIVRSRFIFNGGRLVMMAYYLPASSWAEERDQQNRVVDSFRLLKKVALRRDSVKHHDFWDIAGFDYPESWVLEEQAEQSFDAMHVDVKNYVANETDVTDARNVVRITQGRLGVDLLSRHVENNLIDALAYQLDYLISQGIVIKAQQENPDPIAWPDGFSNVQIAVYDVLDSKAPDQERELWLVAAQNQGYNYFFTLVTPSQEEDFLVWGENVEALNFAVESLKAYDGF